MTVNQAKDFTFSFSGTICKVTWGAQHFYAIRNGWNEVFGDDDSYRLCFDLGEDRKIDLAPKDIISIETLQEHALIKFLNQQDGIAGLDFTLYVPK